MGSGLHRLRATYEPCDEKRLSECRERRGENKDKSATEWRKGFININKAPFTGNCESRTDRETESNGILWFIFVAQHLNIPLRLHSDKLNPLNPCWVKKKSHQWKNETSTILVEPSTFAASGICFHSWLLPCLNFFFFFFYLNKKLSWTLWAKEVGSNENNNVWGRISPYVAEKILEISRCHLETHVWWSQQICSKTHLGPILFISTGVAVVVASKEKSLLNNQLDRT